MPKKLAGFLIFFLIWAVPFFGFAKTIETQISADSVTVNPDQILEAQGNVVVQHGNNTVKADGLTFNKRLNQLKFMGITEFYDGKAIKFSAEQAEISEGLSNGVISAANLLIDETIRIRAEEISLKEGEISGAKGISRVTSCVECEGKEPNWYLTASSAKRDIDNLNIVYRNVTVRVKGLPVAYIPYLRLPDPSVERARGFLVPEAALTSNLASGFKLPYFIPIGLSRDILITPYLSSKTNTIEYRYRQKFQNGDLSLLGALSLDDLVGEDLRYFSQAVGSFKLGYGVNLNFDLGKVGDASYLGDYAYFEDSDLDAQITFEKTVVENQQFLQGDLSYLRENDHGGALDEYFSLSGSYIKNITPTHLPGNLTLSVGLNSSLSVNDDNGFSRPPSSARLSIDYNQRGSMGPIQLSNDLYGNLNSFVNSADSGTTNEEFSSQYGVSTLMTYPLRKRSKGKIRVLTPKVAISLNDQKNDIAGDFFLGTEQLSWGNVYSGSKISSLTESELGLSVSLGFESQTFWETGHRMDIEFAASKLDGLTFAPKLDFGLTDEKFNYLARLNYQNNELNGISASALFASDGKLLTGNFRGKYKDKKTKIEGLYEIVDQEFDNRLLEDLKTFDVLSYYNLADYFQLKSGFRFDLMTDQMAKTSFGMGLDFGLWEYNLTQDFLKEQREKFSLSAIYNDECTRFTISFENRYQAIGASEQVKSLMFRVQLKPLANVVFSQGAEQITF